MNTIHDIDVSTNKPFQVEQPGDPYALNALQRRQFVPAPIQSTGLWAKKGESLVVEYVSHGEEPSDPPQIWIHRITEGDDKSDYGVQKVVVKPGTNTIPVNDTGAIYIASNNIPSSAVRMDMTMISGARPMPTFVQGGDKAAVNDWLINVAAAAVADSSPYAELVGQRMILTMPVGDMAKYAQDPVGILESWDRIVGWAEAQYGLTPGGPYPHIATAARYHFFTKADHTGGSMSSSDEWLATDQGGVNEVVDPNVLCSNDGWGPWHELGHQYEMLAFQTKVEVLENLTSLYVQRELKLGSRLATDNVWLAVKAYLSSTARDYDKEDDLWVSVAMFWQLDLTFGGDFYRSLADRVRSIPFVELPENDEERKYLFIIEASRVSGFDLTPFFEKWGYRTHKMTADVLDKMKLKKLTDPIWENEDGHIAYTYDRSQQGMAGRLSLPLSVKLGEDFSVEAHVVNRTAKLDYVWDIPRGFQLVSSKEGHATFRAPAGGVIPNAFARISCTVTDAYNSTSFSAKIQLKTDGAQVRPEQVYVDRLLKKYDKKELHAWSEDRKGTVNDIYVDRHGGVYRYFRLLESPYGYFPTTATSNLSWAFVGEFNSDVYIIE